MTLTAEGALPVVHMLSDRSVLLVACLVLGLFNWVFYRWILGSGEPLDEKRYTARQASAYIRVLRIAIPVNLVAILLSVVTDLVSR